MVEQICLHVIIKRHTHIMLKQWNQFFKKWKLTHDIKKYKKNIDNNKLS